MHNRKSSGFLLQITSPVHCLHAKYHNQSNHNKNMLQPRAWLCPWKENTQLALGDQLCCQTHSGPRILQWLDHIISGGSFKLLRSSCAPVLAASFVFSDFDALKKHVQSFIPLPSDWWLSYLTASLNRTATRPGRWNHLKRKQMSRHAAPTFPFSYHSPSTSSSLKNRSTSGLISTNCVMSEFTTLLPPTRISTGSVSIFLAISSTCRNTSDKQQKSRSVLQP